MERKQIAMSALKKTGVCVCVCVCAYLGSPSLRTVWAPNSARLAEASLAALLLDTKACCSWDPTLPEEEEEEEEEEERTGRGEDSIADSFAMLSRVEAVLCLVSMDPWSTAALAAASWFWEDTWCTHDRWGRLCG
jgi:hypothetical protein